MCCLPGAGSGGRCGPNVLALFLVLTFVLGEDFFDRIQRLGVGHHLMDQRRLGGLRLWLRLGRFRSWLGIGIIGAWLVVWVIGSPGWSFSQRSRWTFSIILRTSSPLLGSTGSSSGMGNNPL